MNYEHYKMARSFATEYGTFLGIEWSIVFVSFVMAITQESLIGPFACMFLFGLAPIFALYFAWRFKQKLDVGEQFSYGIAWIFSAFMFLYASLLSGVVEFVYFQYLDEGQLFGAFQKALNMPEMVEQYKAMGCEELLETTRMQLGELEMLSPLDLTLNIFGNNIFFSFILSFLVAVVAHMKKK